MVANVNSTVHTVLDVTGQMHCTMTFDRSDWTVKTLIIFSRVPTSALFFLLITCCVR